MQEPHDPTDKTRELVKTLSGLGLPQEDICSIVKISKPTLHKYYRDEIDLGLAEANAKIASTLFNSAVNGNTAAAIFWAKARMGWKEKIEIQNETTVRYVARVPSKVETSIGWQQQHAPETKLLQ